MKYPFKTVLVIVVLFECAIIVFLGYTIYLRKTMANNVLGSAIIVPIRKEYLITSPSADLQYYYEPTANTTWDYQPEWLPEKTYQTINADTLNERFNYTLEKPEHTFRIVTLGDSYTFGFNVNTKDNWAEQLEDLLNSRCLSTEVQRIDVINLGVAGYDVPYIAQRFKIRGIKYDPDLIIWFESGTGFIRLKELDTPLVRKYEQELSQQELGDAMKVGEYYVAWKKGLEEIHSLYSSTQIFEEIHAAWQKFFDTKGTTKVLIATFSTLSSQNKVKLKLWTMRQENTVVFHNVRDIWEENGFLPDGHPNKDGHRMIAEDIYTYLKDRKILICQ